MGFIEETGAAQHMRDAKIAEIYEGTNGIQANDLVGRKLLRDGGEAARELVVDMRAMDGILADRPDADLGVIRQHLARATDAFAAASEALLANGKKDRAGVLVGAVPYLELAATAVAGWLMARGAIAAIRLAAEERDRAGFYTAKVTTARFFAEHRVATLPTLLPAVTSGETVMKFDLEEF